MQIGASLLVPYPFHGHVVAYIGHGEDYLNSENINNFTLYAPLFLGLPPIKLIFATNTSQIGDT